MWWNRAWNIPMGILMNWASHVLTWIHTDNCCYSCLWQYLSTEQWFDYVRIVIEHQPNVQTLTFNASPTKLRRGVIKQQYSLSVWSFVTNCLAYANWAVPISALCIKFNSNDVRFRHLSRNYWLLRSQSQLLFSPLITIVAHDRSQNETSQNCELPSRITETEHVKLKASCEGIEIKFRLSMNTVFCWCQQLMTCALWQKWCPKSRVASLHPSVRHGAVSKLLTTWFIRNLQHGK